MGLQHQVMNNAITSVLATVRGAGAVLILWLISPTIEAFFQWQIIVSVLGAALMALSLWGSLPQGHQPARFRLPMLHSIWRFAAGMTSISAITLFLTHTDKIILSALLPLEQFGYYTLATMVASASAFLVGPISSAVFPRLSYIVSLGNQGQVSELYHRACQFMSVALIPVVLVVASFSFELLLLWTGDPVTAERTRWLVTALTIGTGLNGLMHVPYALQLANGWTRLAFTANLIAVVLLVPLIVALTTHYGAIGAAVVWIILNTGYTLFAIPTMHRRLLRGEQWRWYLIDVGRPLAAVLPVVILAHWIKPLEMTQTETFFYLATVSIIIFMVAILAAPQVKEWLNNYISRWSMSRAWLRDG
jgi:O-antigen/teichoic acid export membrane protein